MSKFDDKFKMIMESFAEETLTSEVVNTDVEYPHVFVDECTPDELINYHGWKMSTPELTEEAEKLYKMFEERGFKIVLLGTRHIGDVCIARPEDYSIAYIGKFPNWKEEVVDEFAMTYKNIIIQEVFKHNGSETNKSLEISFLICNYDEPRFYMDKDKFTGEPVKRHSKYVMNKVERFKKFKPGLSDRVRNKLVNDAIAAFNAIQINDFSKFDILKNK